MSEGRELELVKLEGGDPFQPEYALTLGDSGPGKLVIPGPFEGREFNAVSMSVELDGAWHFALRFVSEGNASSTVGKARCRRRRGHQVLRFEFPDLYRPTEKTSHLRLAFGGQGRGLRILSVDLLRVPLALGLPSPESGPGLIFVGGERRKGVGIAPEQGIRSGCTARPGAVLRFSYAAPGSPEDTAAAPALELMITGSSGRVEPHRFYPTGDGEYDWYEARVPLTGFAGEDVEFLWRVRGDGADPWALAEVGVLRGTGTPARVLLITSDTHRADHLGSAGAGVKVRTPTLDALAERGILFDNCFTATNITNPSHIALMTGTHPRDTGVLTNTEPVSRSAFTLAEAFRRAGFATFASISIRHLSDHISGLGQGFDRMSSPLMGAARDGEVSLAHMVSWIESNEDVPLFLWLHLFDAHEPYEPPHWLLESYYPDPEAAFDPAAPPPEGIPSHVYEMMFPGLKDLDYPKAAYAGEVAYLDWQLYQLLDHPLMRQAVVAFTSDHGESLGQHGIYYAHADLYPDSLHVPMILSFPRGPRGERCSEPVRQIDLGRTLLDLSGLKAVGFPGRNLLDVAREGPTLVEPRFAIGAGGQIASITSEGWHLILALKPLKGHHRIEPRVRHEVALYYLELDPGATDDLVEKEPERARLLRRRLLEWLASRRDRGWRGAQTRDEETLRALEALGYTTGEESVPADLDFYEAGCTCDWCARFDG
jgi:arylsulfatase A-like enzyme